MDGWIGWLIALGLLALIAPFAAAFGRRHGRNVRGTASLALALLGLGQITDPPRRHVAEAIQGEEQGSESTGEPKDATSGS
jgi:hypothetical protein